MKIIPLTDNAADHEVARAINTTKLGELLIAGIDVCNQADKRPLPENVAVSATHITSFCSQRACYISVGETTLALWHEGRQAVLRTQDNQVTMDMRGHDRMMLGSLHDDLSASELKSYQAGLKLILGLK